MVDSDTLRKSNFYTDVVTEAYSNGEGEAVSVSTIDKRVVSVSGWISCKCNIDESMGVKIISPEGIKRVKSISELEDNTMAYYIDFRNAEILFTKDLIGKTIYYEYYGTGVDRMCVNRIYTDLDNYGNILMTLKDMTNKYVQILNYLEGIENLDTKLNELKLSVKSSDISIDELAESILIANTSKSNLDKTITDANKSNEELHDTNNIANNLISSLKKQNNIATINIDDLTDLNNNALENINKLDGENGLIKIAEDKINSLNEKIDLSTTHESNLDSKISSAISHEKILGNSSDGLIKQATDKETSLKTSIKDSDTKKSNLDSSINEAITKRNELNALNTTVTDSTIPTLESKKNEAKTISEDIKKLIANNNIIKKDDYMVGDNGILKNIDGEDVLKILISGRYCGNNCINNPTPSRDDITYVYDIEVRSDKEKKITAKDFNNNNVFYINTCLNNKWRGWTKYVDINTIYPVGIMVEINNTSFNPNGVWSGVWNNVASGTGNKWTRIS